LATLYGRTINWFIEDRSGLSDLRYRNLQSRVRLNDKRQFEAVVGKWVDAYTSLEAHLNASLVRKIHELDDTESAPIQLATALRSALGLAESSPVQNVVTVLESFAVRVLELRPSIQLDSLAAHHTDSMVVIINPDIQNDRLRLTLAHEIAYVLYDGCKHELGWSDGLVEKRAYDFALELLLPQSQLEQAFVGRSFLRLIEFRERYGVSLASMIFRAEKSRVIPTTVSRKLWTQVVERGWKHAEPGFVWRDRAIRFETLMETALHTGRLTWIEAERITGIQEGELRKRITEITDYCGVIHREEEGGNNSARMLRLVTE
jgi:Zn-dependent peptidase ImmA (M78 family)